jgi:adenylate kinase family enzyme
MIFPEGSRGQPGRIVSFKSGIGRLVSQYPDLPIVPVFLSGPERVLPKKSWVPLPFWSEVAIGPPRVCTGTHRDITRHLQNALLELSQSRVAQRRPRQRRRSELAPAVAVLGIDGSGKSTLSRLLAERLSAQQGSTCLVSDRLEFFDRGEPKPLQPLGMEAIRGLVSRYAKRAQSLAAYKIPKLAELILRDRLLAEVNRWYAPDHIVQDGSPLLNMTAWAALYKMKDLSDVTLSEAMAVLAGQGLQSGRKGPLFRELPELGSLDRLGLTHLRLPRVLVLLDVDSAVACRRITSRGKPRQPHETEEKLQRLREAYLRVARILSERWRIPTRVVNGTQPLEQVGEETLRFVQATLSNESNHEPSH